MQNRFGRRVVLDPAPRRVRAGPADFDAAEQVRLGPAKPVQPGRAEVQGGAENLRVGLEPDAGAAPVLHGARVRQLRGRLAARVGLPPQHAVPCDLDFHAFGERVHDRAPDAVQAAGGRVGLAAELAARMQRGEDHFQRAEVLELGVRVHRDAAAVVADGEPIIGLQRHFDEAGMAGHGLVHRIVENLGRQMVQRGFVGAADIHAGPAANRLQPLQHLNVLGRVSVIIARGVGLWGSPGSRCLGQIFARAAFGTAEQIVHAVFPFVAGTLSGRARAGQQWVYAGALLDGAARVL